METFSDDHSNTLLSKEWLVKIDIANSTPYLIKFGTSSPDTTCFLIITDTKKTWAEVLTPKEIARRWRGCNSQDTSHVLDNDEEDRWRTDVIALLGKLHSLGGIINVSFEVVDSNFSDFAFELESDSIKWRWETNFLGYKTSAEILSKHLIMPLISVNHLAFASADPVSELSAADLEKAVDKIGRSAKRTADVHVKNAMTKPRVASTVRRMTSVFNSVSDLPSVVFTVDDPILQPPAFQVKPHIAIGYSQISPKSIPAEGAGVAQSPIISGSIPEIKMGSDSATDSEEDALSFKNSTLGALSAPPASRSPSAGSSTKSVEPQINQQSPEASPAAAKTKFTKGTPSDSDSSVAQPVKKKQKQRSSSDDDSEGGRREQASVAAPPKRGTRQPIKRGGKRF